MIRKSIVVAGVAALAVLSAVSMALAGPGPGSDGSSTANQPPVKINPKPVIKREIPGLWRILNRKGPRR